MRAFLCSAFAASFILPLVVGCRPSPIGSLEMEYTFISQAAVYVEGDIPGILEMVSCRDEYRISQTGFGELSGINDISSTEIDTSVPGVDEEGHWWIKLERDSEGRLMLTYDFEVLSNKEGSKTFRHSRRQTAEVEFVSGSWEALQAGQPVQITYTQEGFEAFNESVRQGWLKQVTRVCEIEIESSGQPWRCAAEIVDMKFSNPIYSIRTGEEQSSGNENALTPPNAPVRMECQCDEEEYINIRVEFFKK